MIEPRSGLVTIAGGKWTTYRRMAEDVIDQAATLADLEPRSCVTRRLAIHGSHHHADQFGALALYGSDALAIRSIARHDASLGTPVHPHLPVTRAEVIWACRSEMARTVDDVLSRRSRSLLLSARDARASSEAVAALMCDELDRDATWRDEQVATFRDISAHYVVRT